MNKLIIIDRGENKGINIGSNFKVYQHLKGKGKTKSKNDLEYFGIAEVIQTFSNLSILRFATLEKNIIPQTGSYISLISPELPNKPKSQINKQIGDSFLAKEIFSNSVSMGFVGGYENFPKAVSNKIEEYLTGEIYPAGIYMDKSLPLRGGFVFSLKRKINRFSAIKFNYGNLSYNRYLYSSIPSDINPAVDLPDDYVKNWRFKIKTIIYTFSADILLGNFKPVISSISKNSKYNNFVYYAGFGPDYASLNYKTDETITLHRYNRDDVIYDETEHHLYGYWGLHGLVGISYFLSSVGIYAEGGYTFWMKKEMNNSFPLRVGLSFQF